MTGTFEALLTYAILSVLLGFYVAGRIKLLSQLTSETSSSGFHDSEE